jgi:hypothetical protein
MTLRFIDFKASESQNFKGQLCFSWSFSKIDRSTQKLTTGRKHYSMFNVRCSLVSYPIRLAAFQVSGGTEPLNPYPATH